MPPFFDAIAEGVEFDALPWTFADLDFDSSDLEFTNHTHLTVSDEQFRSFSDAILAFWKAVPANVSGSQITNIPKWFETAILKDRAERKQ